MLLRVRCPLLGCFRVLVPRVVLSKISRSNFVRSILRCRTARPRDVVWSRLCRIQHGVRGVGFVVSMKTQPPPSDARHRVEEPGFPRKNAHLEHRACVPGLRNVLHTQATATFKINVQYLSKRFYKQCCDFLGKMCIWSIRPVHQACQMCSKPTPQQLFMIPEQSQKCIRPVSGLSEFLWCFT